MTYLAVKYMAELIGAMHLQRPRYTNNSLTISLPNQKIKFLAVNKFLTRKLSITFHNMGSKGLQNSSDNAGTSKISQETKAFPLLFISNSVTQRFMLEPVNNFTII